MRPMDQKRIAKYYDEFLPHLQRDHEHMNARHSRLKVMLSSLITKQMSILDLGCGTGISSLFMARLGGVINAVDISPKLLQYAQKHSAHDNITYWERDITELNFDVKFDGIVLSDVFEHILLPSIPALMRVLEKHSHEKTWIYMSIPDHRYQVMAHSLIPDRLQIVDAGHTIPEILSLFHDLGFEATEIEIFGIDVDCQYNSFLFRRKQVLLDKYRALMS